ncbi:orotidine-5'-phosphate decarboxylase [Psychroflexus sp. CAK8W]|uniref:Orotidine-5'-phosphate decarboxylase n=1 Tax=Psychroflexus longus TaxID=2873596 RepID=A0ABS7XJR6_9FLAO|nr:orotidine-5'-phosphate decarboxylase [Psychroflexus longus]MBZ9779195.1 orotidine-5'-phosphate decarboxylase [Psychroflexus longus]
MEIQKLIQQIEKKKSMLCVGLDVDLEKIPKHLLDHEDPIFEFNKAIIEATQEFCVAFKPNTAFYEAQGLKGWAALKKTIDYLNTFYPEQFTIADAKRGDIGNTSSMYAKAFFKNLNFDSVTVAPYMGRDSVEPFLSFNDKHTILLGLTSNQGSEDFQFLKSEDEFLFENVLKKSQTWENSQQLMYVIGATKADHLKSIRSILPNSFLLIPGVGAQGGSLKEVCKNGMNSSYGLLINSSRGIIYASNQNDFAEKAKLKAKALQKEMALFIN